MLIQIDKLQQQIERFKKNESSSEDQKLVTLFEHALLAAQEGNYPVAAAIFDSNDQLQSVSTNRYFFPKPLSGAHAETNALDDFENQEKGDVSECSMIVSLEPCLMCTSRIVLSGIRKVGYLLPDPAGGGIDTMKSAPDDFRLLAQRIEFYQIKASQQALEIARALYELGEQIWKKHYSL
ncbi:MAG: nucleoside deaminase [Bdellovibrionales bacterium]|nr:nucleoside deaminase [Bdellovibrionales bacterium]